MDNQRDCRTGGKNPIKKTQRRVFSAHYRSHLISISYGEMGEKIREVEQYMLSNLEKMKEIIEGEEEYIAIGKIMQIFSVCLFGSVQYGSVEKWIESDTKMTIPEDWVASKAAEVLAYPDFEFSSAWPWTKQEMIEICRKAHMEGKKDEDN